MESIEPGTLITCSRKGHPIGWTRIPLRSGDPLKLSAVDLALGQERVQGEPMTCKICGSTYFLDGKIHTDQGWLPGDPRMEPVKKVKDFSIRRPLVQGKSEAKQAEALKAHRKAKKDRKDKAKQNQSKLKEARP